MDEAGQPVQPEPEGMAQTVMPFGAGHRIKLFHYMGAPLHVCLRCGAYASKRGHKIKRRCEVPAAGTPKAQKRKTIIQRVEADMHPETNQAMERSDQEPFET